MKTKKRKKIHLSKDETTKILNAIPEQEEMLRKNIFKLAKSISKNVTYENLKKVLIKLEKGKCRGRYIKSTTKMVVRHLENGQQKEVDNMIARLKYLGYKIYKPITEYQEI